jgi:DNA ligase-1
MPLTTPQCEYEPKVGGWPAGAPVPYAHLAATLDVVSATRSRLAKENALTNAMRAVLARAPSAADVEAFCYLLSPAKDAQTGGHRLCPDWHESSRPLGLTHGAISGAVVEATGASRAQLSAAYQRLRDSGDAALAIREGGGRQSLLLKPPPLGVLGVHRALRSLGSVSGTGAEKAKCSKLAAVLRASVGTELKWLVRTCVPHMSCGVSLEASVLPALAAAALSHAHAACGRTR